MIDTPDHDYCITSPSDCLSPMVSTIVTYIAGYVAKELIRSVGCKSCANALYTTSPPDYDKRFILIKLKDNGGLIYPSVDVLKVVEITERVFRRYLAMYSDKPSSSKGLKQSMVITVLSHLADLGLFPNLKDHMFDTELSDNHYIKLCQSIIKLYLKIRFHYEAKKFTSLVQYKGKMLETNLIRLFYSKISDTFNV